MVDRASLGLYSGDFLLYGAHHNAIAGASRLQGMRRPASVRSIISGGGHDDGSKRESGSKCEKNERCRKENDDDCRTFGAFNSTYAAYKVPYHTGGALPDL